MLNGTPQLFRQFVQWKAVAICPNPLLRIEERICFRFFFAELILSRFLM
jgi:hypothetical protein